MNQGIQFHAPPLTKINKLIIIICAVFFVLQLILGKTTGISLEYLLGLSGQGFLSGRVYQIFTFPLVQQGLMGLVFDGLIIWFIGSELESTWGQKIYSLFLIVSALGSGLMYLAFSLVMNSHIPLMGISGLCYALLIAYAIIYPDRTLMFMMIFPMKAKYFCMLLAVILLVSGFSAPYGAASWGHLFAMVCGFAFLFMYTKTRQSSFSKFLELRKQKRKNRANLYLIKDEEKRDQSDPKYWN